MKRIIKCGTAFLLALVLCLCLLPTTAFAASKQVYIWNFPLSDDTLKSSGNWGHGVLNLRFGYRVGASSYTQFRCLDSWQGEVAYCIEPGAPQKNYDSITDHDDTWWDHLTLPDGHPLTPREVQRQIGRIMSYGYHGTIGGGWWADVESTAEKMAWAYATQVLIWEVVAGERDSSFHHIDVKSMGYLTMRRMYAYLTKHRCIDRDVVTAFVQEKMLYEDDPHHNCVFVGLDENGEARHAHLRSTGSQGKVFRINVESSDIKHSFHKNGTDRSLYVFEAPIDLLSHITLYPAGWLEHSYVACCGTSIQPVLERLRQNPKLDTVYLCLDNDEAGEDACDGMLDTLEDMGYDVERLRPEGKDWNDDLRAKRGKAKTPTA